LNTVNPQVVLEALLNAIMGFKEMLDPETFQAFISQGLNEILKAFSMVGYEGSMSMKGMIKQVEDFRAMHPEIYARAKGMQEKWLRDNPDFVATLPKDMKTTTDASMIPLGSDVKITEDDVIADGRKIAQAALWKSMLAPETVHTLIRPSVRGWGVEYGPL
jgi:hypothetical protein